MAANFNYISNDAANTCNCVAEVFVEALSCLQVVVDQRDGSDGGPAYGADDGPVAVVITMLRSWCHGGMWQWSREAQGGGQ